MHDKGVDVQTLVLGLTDTPAQRRLMIERGTLSDAPGTPIPGATSAEDAVAEALASLAAGPTVFIGDMMRAGAEMFASMSRNDAVKMLARMGDAV